MKRLILAILLAPLTLSAQSIFNCSTGFSTGTTSAACGVATDGFSAYNFKCRPNGCSLSGSNANIIASGSTHVAIGFVYQTLVNVQAFSSTFSFVPNGQNIAFTFNNTNNYPGYEGSNFVQGAGCEAGFYQAFPNAGASHPNNVFALEFDSYSPLSTGSFAYSSAQIYQIVQSPCNPSVGGSIYWVTTKQSTSPVPLNSPATTQNTTTGDTYTATIGYDGTTFSVCMVDTTLANGTCSSSTSGSGTFFQKSWANVNIPSLVGSNTAYLAITAASGSTGVSNNLYVTGLTYTVNSAPSFPSLETWLTTSAGGQSGNYAATPTFSPVAGSYGSAQSVTVSCSTASSYICTNLLTPSSTAIYPWPDSQGACQNGTLYSGPISVSASQTLYAVCATTATGAPSAQTSAAYTITGGSNATAVTCTPTSGTSGSPITVTCTNSNTGTFGACVTTNASTPQGNGAGTGCNTGTFHSGASFALTISSTTTSVEVIGIDSTQSDSSVNTYGAYTILTGPTAPTLNGARLSGGTQH